MQTVGYTEVYSTRQHFRLIISMTRNKFRDVISDVQDTIFKILKIEDTILSCILRYFSEESYLTIFKILFESIFQLKDAFF